jgi:hypothetical protein
MIAKQPTLLSNLCYLMRATKTSSVLDIKMHSIVKSRYILKANVFIVLNVEGTAMWVSGGRGLMIDLVKNVYNDNEHRI